MSCEKWVWVELVGFDNNSADLGVQEYIDNAGFIPDLVTLHLSAADFVHLHDPAAADVTFPPDICSYGGRTPCDQSARRTPWTRKQLQALVKEFHKRGCKVFFAVFDLYLNNRFHDEWASNHQEVLATKRDGGKIRSINPLLRLNDGSFYEDFFAAKLAEVLTDYHFDGYHCADGCNHLRFPLYWSDYSDDMIEQFVNQAGVCLPGDLAGSANGNAALLESRADWIWRNKRADWIWFYVERWTQHCRKLFAAVHNANRQVMFNTSWTRDPLEAIYRYGIDYRRIAQAGADWFVVETVGAGNEIGAEGVAQPGFFYQIAATVLLTKASIPHSRIVSLHGVHDVQEDWEVLRHAPTLLEREAYTYPNLFHLDGRGMLTRCIDGFLVCLASEIERSEWKWLRENWTESFSVLPEQVAGATLVWSEKTIEAELMGIVKARTATTHHILHRLLANGAPIYSVVDVDHVGKACGPLVVLNAQHYPATELKRILAYKNGPVIMVGRNHPAGGTPDFQVEDICPPVPFRMHVYGARPLKWELCVQGIDEDKEETPKDLLDIEEPITYFSDLYFRKITDAFLSGCARVIAELAAGARVLNDEPVKIATVIRERGKLRLFIGNDKWSYAHPEIAVGNAIRSITVVTRFPYKPITPTGSYQAYVTDDTKTALYNTTSPAGTSFTVRVPPKGIVVVDVMYVVKEMGHL